MWAMIVKEFRQLRRDRRTVAMMVALPILLLVIFCVTDKRNQARPQALTATTIGLTHEEQSGEARKHTVNSLTSPHAR